jgi:hypothetical protein
MIKTLAVLAVLTAIAAVPVDAAPPPATIGSAAAVDFRVVLTARPTSQESAPTAAVTATVYRRGRDAWERTVSRRLPGTFFWNVVKGPRAVCRLSIATAGTARPHATIRLLLSPSLGCAQPYVLPLT